MLPWRRQQAGTQERQLGHAIDTSDSSEPSALQSTLLPCTTAPTSSLSQGPFGPAVGAGSLRHSYSCPPIRGSSSSSKALLASAQQLPAGRAAMVRMSDSHLQLAAAGTDAERASSNSSHELEPEQSWGSIQPYAAAAAGMGSGPSTMFANGQHHDELERRKFTRNLLSANNKKESLERYKAIMSLIEACKRRLELQLGPSAAVAAVVAEAAWGAEPLASLMQAVLDVGEALASFGNCHFPEHSNEARAILAGDYRALLRQYLSTFGFAFAQSTKQQLSHDMQEEVHCVGSLLATRCDAYDLLYDQLVRHVGLEGRGGPSTLILNHNSASANPNTSITANPTNTTTASAHSKSKALNSGLGAAAIAAVGLVGLLLLRGLRGAATRRSRRSSSSGDAGQQQQQQRPLRVPKGKNGRELLLVSQLTGCADELRKARHNEELLVDDWRLGRNVRLAWPPGPTLPPGYSDGAPDACNVGQLLQEMYG